MAADPPAWPRHLALVGYGKMGQALLHGWLADGLPPERVSVIEPDNPAASALTQRGIHHLAEPTGLANPDIIIFAVKPQVMSDVVPAYRAVAGDACVLSIAAGTTIRALTQALGDATAVIRAMPNTPAAIGRGMTVLVANDRVTDTQRAIAARLLGAVGQVAWVDDEALMDPVTAVSGSGPAYAFLLIEAMAAAGVASGLPQDLALQLATATVEGAGALAATADDPPDVLRRNVTSPGGTTAAALEVLMRDGDGLPDLMRAAVDAATRRSRELAG